MTNPDLPSDTSRRASRQPPVLVAEKVTPDPTTSRPSSESLTQTIQRATAPTSAPNIPHEFMHRAAWRAGVLGGVNVFTQILAARLLVLVAIGGSIWLTWYALGSPDVYRLVALGIYCGLVVVPSIVLAAMGR